MVGWLSAVGLVHSDVMRLPYFRPARSGCVLVLVDHSLQRGGEPKVMEALSTSMAVVLSLPGCRPPNVALKDSARALSAELPIALMDWRTPARWHASAKARLVYWAPWSVCMIAPARAAAGAFGGGQGIDDEAGAHVIGDGPTGQAA